MSISVASAQSTVDTMAASGSKSKGDAGQTTGGLFFTTLAQCMTQEEQATNTDRNTAEISTLFASLADLTNVSDDAEEPQLKLLDSLLSDLEQAEQLLHEQPDLIAVLQQWLQQAQMLTNTDQITATPEMSTVMQMMTSQPESLIIVVRDQLEQIREMLQSASSPSQQMSSSKTMQEGVMLLESLQALLQRQPKQADNQLFDQVMKNTAGTNDQTAALTPQDSSQEVMTAGQFALRSEGMQTSKVTHVMRASHFADDMSNFMIKQMLITSRNGISQAKITLYPENLGQVDVRLTMQSGQLVAQFVTEHATAREMLDSQLSLLRGALQSQGIVVEKLEVSQQSSVAGAQNLSSSMFHREQQSNGGQGQSSSNQTGERTEIEGELETLEDIHNEILREQLTGSSFQASV